MEEKLMRQKIVERDEFDWDDRRHIAKKSNDRCCHCGKTCFTNYGATVDHFIPLSKGGTNCDINMVMLCHDCNQEKNNKILYPGNYLDYLNDEDKKKLNDYFESYVQSFEYIERQNILSCDEYIIEVLMGLEHSRYGRGRKKHKTTNMPSVKFALRKAREEDLGRLSEYFIATLKRSDMLEDEGAAYANIDFWYRFGCIYYIENVEGIRFMLTVTMKEIEYEDGRETEHCLVMNLFPKSSNDMSLSLTRGILYYIPKAICEEQGLCQIPINYRFMETDKLGAKVFYHENIHYFHENLWLMSKSNMIAPDVEDDSALPEPKNDEKLKRFWSKFKNISDDIEKWNELQDLPWMIKEIYQKVKCRKENENG